MGLVALVFYNLKINKGFNENYISKNQTTAINGIFVILVFMFTISLHIIFTLLNKNFHILKLDLRQKFKPQGI